MRITTLGAAIAMIGLTSGAFAEGTSTSPSPSTAAGAQNAAYCLETSAGAKTCTYATLAACEARKTGSDKCSPNPSSTTGAGSPMSPSSPSSPSR